VREQRPGEGKQRALRRCLEHADGSILYLTDADCLLSNDAFERLIAPIARGEAAVVTGTSRPRAAQLKNTLVRYQWLCDLVWVRALPRTVDGVLGRNCALLREVVESTAAFDAPVATGTDYHLSRVLVRAGHEIRAVPDSQVETDYPETPLAYLRMWRRWNKNLLIHGVRFGAWNDVRGVGLVAAVTGVILLGPIMYVARLGPALWSISALLFAAAMASRVRRLLLGSRLAGVPVPWRCLAALPVYTCLDLLSAILAVRDALDPRVRSRW